MTEAFCGQESDESDNEPLSLIVTERNGRDIDDAPQDLSRIVCKSLSPELPQNLSINLPQTSPLELSTRPLFTKIFEKKKSWRKTENIPITNDHEVSVDNGYIENGQGYSNTFITTYIMPPIKLDEGMSDVWLDAKSINQVGPMSCVICLECFINKSKLIMHYILNHNKAYCGTCRYLVQDNDAWATHWRYHMPLRCSHCEDEFLEEDGLRMHYRACHLLSHCRMCSLMLPSGAVYDDHLKKKHMVTVSYIDEENDAWSTVQPNSWNFSCSLCKKSNLQNGDFVRHFLYHHKFSLKCLASLVNAKDLGFSVLGASLETLTGSVECDKSFQPDSSWEEKKINGSPDGKDSANGNENPEDNYQFLEALIPEIKQEVLSDDENIQTNLNFDSNSVKHEYETLEPGTDLSLANEKFLLRYTGREDFDLSVVEFVPIRKYDTDYVVATYVDMNTSIATADNFLAESKVEKFDMVCPLCFPAKTFASLSELTEHVIKNHSLKYVPNHTCRLCMTFFHTQSDMQKHIITEKEDFRHLYMCQICDIEFESRELARNHLSVHWETLKELECSSPQIGFKCRYCYQLFWHEMDRERHHCEEHFASFKENFYKCITCLMVFSDKLWWASHVIQEHGDNPGTEDCSAWCAFKCVLCCRVFKAVGDLREHFLDLHPTDRRLYCAVAGCISKPFKMGRYLKQHHEIIHNIGRSKSLAALGGLNRALQCEECGKVMRTVRAAATHRTVVHGHKSTTRFKCRLCNVGLPSIQDRKLHYMLLHPGIAPFNCTVCGKGYNNKSALYTHRSQSHSVHLMTYTCSFCNKNFNKRDSYKEHLLIHIGPRHACPHCSRIFVQRSNMLRHIRLHTGEKPYPCVHCEKTFADKGACNAHIRTHTRQDAHPCMYCGQEFLQKQKLKYHLRKHTGEDLETCLVCEKKFTNQTNLREHMRTHDDSSPISCEQCGKVFMSRRYMERHIRDNHSSTAEVHLCPLCGRACPRLAALRHHILTHATLKQMQCLLCPKRYNGKKSMNKHLKKRHGISLTDDRYSTSFYQLDPRQCGLGLDEDTICRVFGPEKNIKPKLPIDFSQMNFAVHKSPRVPRKYEVAPRDEDSDTDYKPAQNIIKLFRTDKKESAEEEGPISGLELATIRTRARRETSKNVSYAFGSDEDDDKRIYAKHKKSKVKLKKKHKNSGVLKNNMLDNFGDSQECDIQEPMFPLVEIKCEPVDYDEAECD